MAQLTDTTASSLVASESEAASSVAPEFAVEELEDVKLHKVGDLHGHESRIFSAEFSPRDDGLLVTCSEDSTCRVWDVTEGKQILALRDHTEAVYSATWSPDGLHLLTGASDGKIILWDAISGRNKKVFEPGGDVFGAVFLDADSIVSAADDKITIWDIQTGMPRQSRAAKPATDYVFGGRSRNPDAVPWVFCLQACAQHNVLALGIADATVRVWDSSLEEQVVLRGHAKDVCSLRIKDDASELVSGSGDSMAGVWDLRKLEARLVLKGHAGSVHDSCYLPSSGALCTVSNDKSIRFWAPTDGAPLGMIGPGNTAQLCCATSDGLNGIAVGGGENKTIFGADFRVALYSADADGLASLRVQRAGRPQQQAAEPDPGLQGAHAADCAEASESDAAQSSIEQLQQHEPELAAVCRMSAEEVEDLSLKGRLASARALRKAAASGSWDGMRGLLVGAAEKLLFDVDEDAPKHAQDELEAVQELKNRCGL